MNESNIKCNFYNYIPTRYVFVLLGFLGFNLVYAYKVVLSVVIVVMVNATDNDSISNECSTGNNSNNNSLIYAKQEEIKYEQFNWTDDQRATALGSFFYGYVLTQLPAGILAERLGAKWVFGCSLLVAGILSLLGPITARYSVYLFIATRIGQGLAEGVVFPCMHVLLAQWLPKFERSFMSTIIYTGSMIGTVITLPLAGYLCDEPFLGGWPAIFYILGLAGILWFILWAIFIYEKPDLHPCISSKELNYIKYGQGNEEVKTRPSIPWADIFKSVPFWALILTHTGQNWGFLTILTELPTYFQTILRLDIKKNGIMSSLPYLLQAICGWLAGFVGDRIRQSGKVKVNIIRKVCNSIGFIGPSICLVGVALAGCNSSASIALFALAMGLNGFVFSGFLVTHIDMAPNFAGTLMGITNSIGNLPGFIAPMVVSELTKNNNTLSAWQIIFYLSAGVYFIAALIYIFFATAKLQKWATTYAKIDSDTEDNGTNNETNNKTNNEEVI